MELIPFIIASLAVLFAGAIQVLTGFGFAIVSIPLLLYVFPGYQGVLICMVLGSAILLLQFKKTRNIARWDIIWRLTLIGLAGLIAGVYVSHTLDANMLKGIVGAVVLLYAAFQWIQIEIQKRLAVMKEQAASSDISNELKTRHGADQARLPKGFYIAGLVSGLLIGVVGMPGPPVVAVLIPFLEKEKFHATLVGYFLINFLFALTIALFIFQRGNPFEVLLAAAILIIPTYIGYLIGHPLRKFINEQNFKRLVFSLLLFVGLTSMWQAIAAW